MSRLILSFVFVICLSGSRSQQLDTSPNLVQDLANLVCALQNEPSTSHAQNRAYNAPPAPSPPMNHFTSPFQTPPPSVQQAVVTDLIKLLGLFPSHSHAPQSYYSQYPAANPLTSSFQAPTANADQSTVTDLLKLLMFLSSPSNTYNGLPITIQASPAQPPTPPSSAHQPTVTDLLKLLILLSSDSQVPQSYHTTPQTPIIVPQLPSQLPTITPEATNSLLSTLLSVLSLSDSSHPAPENLESTEAGEPEQQSESVQITSPERRLSTTEKISKDAPVAPPEIVIQPGIAAPPQLIASVVPQAPGMNMTCLNCICSAYSDCIATPSCTRKGCGFYGIRFAYWKDAGQFVVTPGEPANRQAYLKCVNDRSCADKTVQGYMARHTRDCNKDGVVDCFDYMQMHVNGVSCWKKFLGVYSFKLSRCMQSG